jgi:hypothetical protein
MSTRRTDRSCAHRPHTCPARECTPTLPNNLHTYLADLPRRGGIRLMTWMISLSLISIAGRMHVGPAALPALVTGGTVTSAAPAMEMLDGSQYG